METETQAAALPEKIDLLLKATGDAPIMIRKKWSVNADQTVGWVITFIRQYLKLPAEDSLVSRAALFFSHHHSSCGVISFCTLIRHSLQHRIR
jgi:hypothetical protein